MTVFDRDALALKLKNSVRELPFPVSDLQQNQLLDYIGLIHKWNKAYNLTSVRNPYDMLTKHIIDSLAVVPYLQGSNFIDVGTGPGLPGIPLAIMLPKANFTLLDSLGKRVRFMKQTAYELEIGNIVPIHSRVEAHLPQNYYDGVISRAFASLKDMLHWCQHLVDSSSTFYALKGQLHNAELLEISKVFTVEVIHNLSIPGLEGQRHLIEIKKA